MSSDEEDVNPKKQNQGGKNAVPPKKVEEETTDMNVNEEVDDEEDQNIKDNEDIIRQQISNITVKVDNPQTKAAGALSKNYTVYDVNGNDKDGIFSVKRRFSDFFELRARLLENWPGFFIPPLPEKQNTGNMNVDFIKYRQSLLDHFMQRCGRMPHIFYSEEMQLFLRTTTDNLSKQLAAIKPLSPTKMYKRNKELFPECDKAIPDKIERNVKKYFLSLESTIAFFKKFRTNAKAMEAVRKSYKTLKTNFVKYAVNDYKNKLKNPDAKKEVDDQYREYQRVEREDDLSDFLKSLKLLELDLTSFFSIKQDLKNIKITMEKIKKKQEEANKNLSKVRSQESEEVKDGLFKKTTKTERIVQLEAEIEEVVCA